MAGTRQRGTLSSESQRVLDAFQKSISRAMNMLCSLKCRLVSWNSLFNQHCGKLEACETRLTRRGAADLALKSGTQGEKCNGLEQKEGDHLAEFGL